MPCRIWSLLSKNKAHTADWKSDTRRACCFRSAGIPPAAAFSNSSTSLKLTCAPTMPFCTSARSRASDASELLPMPRSPVTFNKAQLKFSLRRPRRHHAQCFQLRATTDKYIVRRGPPRRKWAGFRRSHFQVSIKKNYNTKQPQPPAMYRPVHAYAQKHMARRKNYARLLPCASHQSIQYTATIGSININRRQHENLHLD